MLKETAGLTHSITATELFEACRELFGAEVDLSHDFLRYLQPGGAKAAFRKKAKETHPDLAAGLPPRLQRQQAEQFQRARAAYELLVAFFRHREEPGHGPAAPGGSPGRERDYYQGPLPSRPLQLGRYLYFRGIIPFRVLLQALTWQRACRPAVGVIARELGLLTAAEVQTILTVPLPGRFCERAVKLGLLKPSQASQLLLNQRSRHRRIGHYFVQHGLVTSAELEQLLREFHRHNARFAPAAGR